MSDYEGAHNLQAMASMGRYNRWIYETVAPYIGQSVLEAGCGNGNITPFLIRHPGVKRYVGVDLSPTFCQELERSITPPSGVQCKFQACDLIDPALLKLASPLLNTIVCANVAEHVEDDGLLFERFRDMLTPGGWLVLQVPAFQWLYGTIDAIDQHHRRYSRPDLIAKVTGAGLHVKKAFYFNLMGIAAWVWHGKILRLNKHSEVELGWWDKAVPLLQMAENWIKPPVGLSLFVMAQR